MKKSIQSTALLFLILSIVGSTLYGGTGNEEKQPFMKTDLGYSKVLELDFEQALQKVKSELKKEGFGILTEVDVQATMKKKLDIDYKPYHILGACNPALANQAIQAEPQIGLMLPCKLIVYVDEEGKTVVAAVDPVRMMQDVNSEELSKVAEIVQEKFRKVLMSI
jgi:uncharacterized protein (DUF302 family)